MLTWIAPPATVSPIPDRAVGAGSRPGWRPGREFRIVGARFLVPLLVLPLLGASAPKLREDWNSSKLDTARNAKSMSRLERDVVFELNKARSDPARYSALYIAPLLRRFEGKALRTASGGRITTVEGARAVTECDRAMKRAKATAPLTPSAGLAKAARSLASEQAGTGGTGHRAGDGSSPFDRMDRHGKWSGSAAENIEYGGDSAREIVVSLLVDDGVSSRGHRRNILNGDFRRVGVAAGRHPQFGTVCVIDFAQTYRER